MGRACHGASEAVRILAVIDERSRHPLLAALSRRRLRSVELRT